MKRGDVRWYLFEPPDKRRPVRILTRNSAISFLTNVTVAPITTYIRNIPTEVILTREDDGVLTECAVNLDNLQTVRHDHMGALITTLSASRLREMDRALCFALGIDALV